MIFRVPAHTCRFSKVMTTFDPPTEITSLLGGWCPLDTNFNPLVSIKKASQNIGQRLRAQIYQVVVCPCDINGRVIQGRRAKFIGNEDNAYLHNPSLHRGIPRSYSIINIEAFDISQDKWCNINRKITHGFYKFSSIDSVDEDSEIACRNLIQPEHLSEVDQVIITEKANGKSQLVSGVMVRGERFLVGGSKNRHRVVSLDRFPDSIKMLDQYDQDLVIPMFQAFYRQWESLDTTKQSQLFEKLLTHSLCGEFLDGKHMVALETPESTPTVVWFGLVENKGRISDLETLGIPMLECIQFCRGVDLPTVNCREMTLQQYHNWKQNSQSRSGQNTEGSVIHFLRDGNVVAMEKYKSSWYVVIRMLRQIILACRDDRLSIDYRSKIHDRLQKRNEFLHLSQEEFQYWFQECCGFSAWFRDMGYHPKTVGIQSDSIGMGNMWNRYQAIPDEADRCPGDGSGKNTIKTKKYYRSTGAQPIPTCGKKLIIFQGIPGIGKSYLGKQLAIRLKDLGVAILEQDQFSGKKSGSKCLNALEGMLRNPAKKVILLLRNNACPQQYQKYVDKAKRHSWEVDIILPNELHYTHPHNNHLLTLCMKSVLDRETHPKFDVLDMDKRLAVVMSFWGEYEVGNIGNGIDRVMNYNCLAKNLPEINKTLESFLTDYKNKVVSVPDSFQLEPLQNGELLFREATQEYLNISTWRDIPVSTLEDFIRQDGGSISKPSATDLFMKGYIGVEIPTPQQKKIQSWIHRECLDGQEPDGHTRTFLHHSTLIHSNTRNKELWRQLLELCCQDVLVEIQEVYLGKLETKDTIDTVVLKVSLTMNDSNIDYLVDSGFPHITGILPRSQMPVFSRKFVEGNHYQEKKLISESDRESLRFQGKIRWYH